MRIFRVVFFLVGAVALLRAQDSGTLKLPQGPLIVRAGTPSQWVITSQLAPLQKTHADSGDINSPTVEGTPRAPKPEIITVQKRENQIYERKINRNDAVIETWRTSRGTAINDSHGWIVSPGAGTTFNDTDYSKTDFAGFDWISLKNFSGVREVLGKHCLVFKSRIFTMNPQEVAQIESVYALQHPSPAPPFNTDALKTDVEADVDAKSRLPVSLTYATQEGVVTRTYVFETPSGPSFVPAEVEKLFNAFEAHEKRMAVPIAPI